MGLRTRPPPCHVAAPLALEAQLSRAEPRIELKLIFMFPKIG
jgi:hypothetical protein